MELDKTDWALLSALQEDARLSLRKLAQKIGISTATVLNRLQKLEKNGVIRGYSVLLDTEKLGFDLVALIELRISKGKLFEVEKKIASLAGVCGVYDVTGGFDCVLLAKFKNRKSLDYFVKKVQTFDFVERTETKIVLNTIKEEALKI